MCGRCTLRTPLQQLILQFRLDPPEQAAGVESEATPLRPRYNVAPTQHVAVVRQLAGRRAELVSMRWVLVRPLDPWLSSVVPPGCMQRNSGEIVAAFSSDTFGAV